ncbi:hypothetical protein WD019_16345 [Fictibacillus sp. Mic-4]|uniref:hypothetical protein n=1 Tax=Fictibacillus TaxID=1329200 RepID=UPI0003F6A907|nr:hypothetical protein [Fictibacillus gelatini]
MSEQNGQYVEQERERHVHSLCKQHMYCHVVVTMQDGTKTDGIIYQVDDQNVYMLIPKKQAGHGGSGQYPGRQEAEDQRFFGPFGVGPWGPGGGGRWWYYYQWYQPATFPLASITGITLFPFPYYYPAYPYIW